MSGFTRALVAAPVSSVQARTGAVVITKADVGLANVDNTTDAGKPVSTAQAAAIATAIANLVNSSPSTLDTLNELAAALGNDPNFATTLATQLGLKLNASGVSAFMATVLDDLTAAAARTTLGVIDPTPTGTLGNPGSLLFPGGLVIKWGQTGLLTGPSSGNAINFAAAFPTGCFQVITDGYCATGTLTVNGFVIDNLGGADQAIRWLAVGH